MPQCDIVPARHIQTEFMDHNSRFITNAGPAFSVEEAQAFIASIKKKYPDASHHVPVYLIGHGNAIIAHCSDDGEPAGTAGRPALAVLKGSGFGDIVVVVTRYFGGTKLGTGGLVRAYGDSVRAVLAELPRARKISTTLLMFVVPYSLFEQTQILISNHRGKMVDENFAVDVTLTVRMPDDYLECFKKKMVALTHGQIEFIIIEHRDNTIMPLN